MFFLDHVSASSASPRASTAKHVFCHPFPLFMAVGVISKVCHSRRATSTKYLFCFSSIDTPSPCVLQPQTLSSSYADCVSCMRPYVEPEARAIEVSHAACKGEFRPFPQSRSCFFLVVLHIFQAAFVTDKKSGTFSLNQFVHRSTFVSPIPWLSSVSFLRRFAFVSRT